MTRTEAESAVHGRVPQFVKPYFSRYVPGRSFADLGCLWNADGAYCFYAELIGAVSPMLAVDVNEETPQFSAYSRALTSNVTFLQKNILDLQPANDGTYDVVFCSGVLYHMPDPMLALSRIVGISKSTVILVTHTVPGEDETMKMYPFSATPATMPWEKATPRGRDQRFEVRYGDFAPWWFGFTERCVESMLRVFRFATIETDRYVLKLDGESRLNPQFSLFVASRLP